MPYLDIREKYCRNKERAAREDKISSKTLMYTSNGRKLPF